MSTAENAARGGEVARGSDSSPAPGVRVDVPQTENEQAGKLADLIAAALCAQEEADPRAPWWERSTDDVAEIVAAALSAPSVQTGEQP